MTVTPRNAFETLSEKARLAGLFLFSGRDYFCRSLSARASSGSAIIVL